MNAMLGVFGMGGGEMLFVMGAVLLLFGAKKIPEFAKGLGMGIKEFKKATREVTDEVQNAMHDETPAPRRAISAPVQPVEVQASVAQSAPVSSTPAPAVKRID